MPSSDILPLAPEHLEYLEDCKTCLSLLFSLLPDLSTSRVGKNLPGADRDCAVIRPVGEVRGSTLIQS